MIPTAVAVGLRGSGWGVAAPALNLAGLLVTSAANGP